MTPESRNVRPTLEKTREALYNVLMSRFDITAYEGYDFFAGSGALGFEGISRGMPSVVFNESDSDICSFIKKNIENLEIERRCKVICRDAIQWAHKRQWSIAPKLFLLDPPYNTDLPQKMIDILASRKEFLAGSLIVVETEKKSVIIYPSEFVVFQQKNYGKTRMDFIEISPS